MGPQRAWSKPVVDLRFFTWCQWPGGGRGGRGRGRGDGAQSFKGGFWVLFLERVMIMIFVTSFVPFPLSISCHNDCRQVVGCR